MTTPKTSAIVSKCETRDATQPNRIHCVLRDALRAKGWSVQAAAAYLGVSRQRLYSVFADSSRARLWECAIAGMPVCTPALTPSLKKRTARPAYLAKTALLAHYPFAVGDVVVCDKYVGFADDGDEGVIAQIRGATDMPELLVRMPGGEDWFGLDTFNAHFLTTGR